MNTPDSAHRDTGLKALLTMPQVYNLFSRMIVKRGNMVRFVEDIIKPFPGCRILDIGCGTGTMLSYFPNTIGEYNGFDMNPSYIEFAQQQWKSNDTYHFFCENVNDATLAEKDHYDIIIAIGILHHLSDDEMDKLIRTAYHALKPGGALITYDPVFVENQHWFAKWFISRDRGQAVRTVEGYKNGLKQYFTAIEEHIWHHTLRVPYTVSIMKCIKEKDK